MIDPTIDNSQSPTKIQRYKMKLRKYLLHTVQIILILLSILLILSTFIPQHRDEQFYREAYPSIISQLILQLNFDGFYASPIHILLWIIFTFLLVLFAISKFYTRKSIRIFHIILILMAIVIFADKSYNKDLYLEMAEGESINFGKLVKNDEEDYDFKFTLDDFTVNYHAGSRMPSAFISTVSYQDETQNIEVNKPLAIGEYRLYQSTYDMIDRFEIDIDTLTIDITEEQPYESDTLRLEIAKSRTPEKKVAVSINDAKYTVPLNESIFLDDYKIHIAEKEPIMRSGFQVSSTFGMRTLFVLGILFFISLAWCFWGNNFKFSDKAVDKR